MMPMISPLTICEATNEPFETQKFSGSAKPKAIISTATEASAGATIRRVVRTGVFMHSGTSPKGPVEAPSMAPTKGAFEVSRSRRKYARRVA